MKVKTFVPKMFHVKH